MSEVVRGSDLTDDLELDCDVVVVGSGAGGAVVAKELAEAGQDVIVLEEGSYWRPEEYGRMRPSENMRHLWRDGGLTFAVGLGDTPVINVMMGRCVGGSSVLTGGVCFRVPDAVMHEWHHRMRIDSISQEAMEPCYRAVEEAVHVETVPEHMRSRSTQLFARGAQRMGYEVKPVRRNTKDCNGCGRCNFGCPHGAKLSVDIAYLPKALAAGARLYSNVRVDRVTTHGARAAGIEGRILNSPDGKPGSYVHVRARRVCVAAGAFATPLLLKRSGLGKQSGQLGKNLTLHPGFRVMGVFDETVNGWKGSLQAAYTDSLEHRGITLVGLFIPPGALAGTMPGIGPEHVRRAREIPHIAIFGGMIHDEAGGAVHSVLGKPFMTYRMGAKDRATVPELLRIQARIFFEAGAREVILPVLGLPPVTADQLDSLDLEHVPGKSLECASQHPLGTARMGSTAEHSVVDPFGRSWELDELYVADGSIVPTSLGVNPQLSIMSLATRVAWAMRDAPLPD